MTCSDKEGEKVKKNKEAGAGQPVGGCKNGLDKFCDTSLSPSIRSGHLRPGKRYDAVERFLRKMRWEILEQLPPVTIWAPALTIAGAVLSQRTLLSEGALVYLSPCLEFESQRFVDHTVARGFAHIFLEHHLPGNTDVALAKPELEHDSRPHEIAADNLAAEWGFQRPRRQTWLTSTTLAFARGFKTQRELDRFRTMLGLHEAEGSREK